MVKQPVKQITLMVHSDDFPEAVTRTREEGEYLSYTENVGHPPNNLPPEHSGYKLWTWKTKRDGDLAVLLGLKDD